MKIRTLLTPLASMSLLATAVLAIAMMWAPLTHAAQGCGHGYHMTTYGRCVPNSPGPWARALPGRPDCWLNRWGAVRCWR